MSDKPKPRLYVGTLLRRQDDEGSLDLKNRLAAFFARSAITIRSPSNDITIKKITSGVDSNPYSNSDTTATASGVNPPATAISSTVSEKCFALIKVSDNQLAIKCLNNLEFDGVRLSVKNEWPENVHA